jgi:ribose-phosphate pyrophosphokinase
MLIFSLDDETDNANRLVAELQNQLGQEQVQRGDIVQRHIRIASQVKQQDIIVLCQLHQPNNKLIDLMFFAETAKQLGANSVHLVAPYLAYMRQDKRFNDGECITSRHASSWISERFDSLITIDPHLHRYHSLNEIYSIPSYALHATDLMAEYIRDNIAKPLVIGPDSESEQWAKAVAELAGCDAIVLSKIRHGDHDVEVSLPELGQYPDHQPVLIDDIISTGRTMIKAADNIVALGGKPPICIGVHGVFSPRALDEMKLAKIADVVTCSTIEHETNKISVVKKLALAIIKMQEQIAGQAITQESVATKFDANTQLKGE